MGRSGMPQLDTGSWVTDGGLETDLIFNHGAELPEFAAFPLVEDDAGTALLESYYAEYAAIAAAAGAGLLVETPTWRANPDWGPGSGTTRPRSTASTGPPSTWCAGSSGARTPTGCWSVAA